MENTTVLFAAARKLVDLRVSELTGSPAPEFTASDVDLLVELKLAYEGPADISKRHPIVASRVNQVAGLRIGGLDTRSAYMELVGEMAASPHLGEILCAVFVQ